MEVTVAIAVNPVQKVGRLEALVLVVRAVPGESGTLQARTGLLDSRELEVGLVAEAVHPASLEALATEEVEATLELQV